MLNPANINMKWSICAVSILSCAVAVHCAISIQTESKDAVPNEYLVTLKENILSSKSGNWIESFSSKIQTEYGCLVKKHFEIQKMSVFNIEGVLDKIEKLKALAEVAHVEKNIYVKAIQSTPVCNEQQTGRNLWGLSRLSRREKIPLFESTSYSWQSIDDGDGVDAYILDTGIDVNHTEFEGRARWGHTMFGINEEEMDFHGHGTHVSGTVAGRTYGVAKKANLVAVKVLNKDGVGSMANVVEGIQYAYDAVKAQEAASGKKAKAVLNLSLGGTGRIIALEQAIEKVTEAGLIVVVAAGNEFDDACVHTPANVPTAITVAATNIDDNMSEFSNYGTCVDIMAPGEGILSSFPGGGTALLQGTSMASPHVAGAVARYLSRYDPPPTPQEIKDMLANDGTKDKINLAVGTAPAARETTTTNLLLYMSCDLQTAMSGADRNRTGQTLFISLFTFVTWFITL